LVCTLWRSIFFSIAIGYGNQNFPLTKPCGDQIFWLPTLERLRFFKMIVERGHHLRLPLKGFQKHVARPPFLAIEKVWSPFEKL